MPAWWHPAGSSPGRTAGRAGVPRPCRRAAAQQRKRAAQQSWQCCLRRRVAIVDSFLFRALAESRAWHLPAAGADVVTPDKTAKTQERARVSCILYGNGMAKATLWNLMGAFGSDIEAWRHCLLWISLRVSSILAQICMSPIYGDMYSKAERSR